MKTILKFIIFCMFFCGFSTVLNAQEVDNPKEEFITNFWYSTKLMIDGEEYLLPETDNDEQVTLSVIELGENNYYKLETVFCEAEATNLEFLGENQFAIGNFLILSSDGCDGDWPLAEMADYFALYFHEFWIYEEADQNLSPPYRFEFSVTETDGNKKLIVTNENGDEAYYQEVPYLSVDDQQKLNLKLYPNPVSDHLFIENLTENVQLEIYDLSGRKLLNQEINNSTQSVNVSQLSAGIYFYGLSQNGEKIKTGKLVKGVTSKR